jgi:hypothetical protein
MAAQAAAADVVGADNARPTTIASLPHALLARVLARLPVDARLRCSEVCRGWRDCLTAERSLWTALDLSPSSGVTHEVTDALLRAAVSKVGGGLQSLDVCGCFRLSHGALLAVVTANAASLLELRVADTFPAGSCEMAEGLLHAAPRLRQLLVDVLCDAGDATRLLRGEGVFQPLRVCKLHVLAREAGGAALRALAAALAASLPLQFLSLIGAQLHALDVLDAVVDAVLANRLPELEFFECGLSPASAPALARLLGGGALTSLSFSRVDGDDAQLLDAPAAALLGGALRTNTVLQRLRLSLHLLDYSGAAAAAALLSSLASHPSLRALCLSSSTIPPTHAAACAAAALFALIVANAPALTELDVSCWQLGDAGLRPLMDALPRNTHLRDLYLSGDGMSEAFARDVLLPAVRANTTLTQLLGAGSGAAEREAAQFVQQRRAAAHS